MKRILTIITLLTAVFISSLTASTVYAKTDAYKYMRIIDENTPLYSDVLGTDLVCYLPYTYYVRVLSHGEYFLRVECYGNDGTAAFEGYVPAEKLYDDGLEVDKPYADVKATTAATTILYFDKELTMPQMYVFPERSLKYYGQIPYGDTYIYFVGYNGRVGYVKETDLYSFEVPNHSNELTFLITENEAEPELTPQTETFDLTGIKVVIIVCLVFAGMVGLFIAFRPKAKLGTAATYYDENDYE